MRSFLELLLAMAVGHAFTGNPFFGAAVFLFANIVKTYLFCNISKLRHANGASYTSVLLLMLVAAAGLALAFLYPYVADAPAAGLACGRPGIPDGDADHHAGRPVLHGPV